MLYAYLPIVVVLVQKLVKRSISREYEKRGKSQKYHELKSIFRNKMKSEVIKYKAKIYDDIANGNRSCTYSALRRLGVRPGDKSRDVFSLPAHVELNLTAQQSAEIIADHFAAISNEYEPICIEKFPPKMKEKLFNPDLSHVPTLTEYEVFNKICKSKKPNSSVPGDLPKRIIQEFSVELAAPVTEIYNSILKSFQYPRQWVIEHQIPIPKVHPPGSEENLRNIAKTTFLSKCFESFLADWLLPIVTPFIDPCQYGLKGASISHYLFQLLKFTHDYLDLKEPHAVVVALVDQSQAFNRVSHQMVIEDLNDMHVPPWLLLILISYLSKRSMVLSYKGATSSPRNLPGSSPQGAFLGIFFFIVKYNGASLRPSIPKNVLVNLCGQRRNKCKLKHCSTHKKDMHAIYLDDLSEAEAINLKKQLLKTANNKPYPLNYHDRTEHVFPTDNSSLQKQLCKVENFSVKNQMKINQSKSKVLIFNKSKSYDFTPEFSFSSGLNLEVIEQTRLLGIELTTDLRWSENTKSIYKKAMSKMWLLRRMKILHLEPKIILDYYLKEIRVLAEQGVVIWNSGLTKGQINELEKIQKVALKIILGNKYQSYKEACKLFDIKLLSERRLDLCTNFAIKLFKSNRCEQFFTLPRINSRSGNLVVERKVNTKRCYNAPHNYLARLINSNKHRIKTST